MPLYTNASVNELPPWLTDMYQRLGERTQQITNSRYVPYQEERIAHTPKELKQAFEMGNKTGEHLPYLAHAESMVKGAHTPFTKKHKEYMNPYQKEVVNRISEEGNRNFTENILPALEAKFVRLGQHGSKRHAKLAREAARDVQNEISANQSRALAQGYQQAAQLYNADQARALEAARELSNLGGLKQAGKLADIAALTESGKYQQQQEQSMKDMLYQDFLRRQNYPLDMLHQQAAFLNGMPQMSQTMQYQQTPGAPQLNLLGQLGNLAGNIYSARLASR